jgi:hypothetical protein
MAFPWKGCSHKLGTNGNSRNGSLFSIFSIIGLSVSLKFFLQVNGIVGFGGFEFVFLVLLSELWVQCECVIVMYKHGSYTLLMHFVVSIVFIV